MTELNNMPIRDRKAYIKKHNGEELKLINKKNRKSTDNSILINQVARMKQEQIKNLDNFNMN